MEVAGTGRWVREEGERKEGQSRLVSNGQDTQFNRRKRRTESASGCSGRPYLGNWHKDKQNDRVVCDHEAVFT